MEIKEVASKRHPVGVGQDFLERIAAMQVTPQRRSPRLDALGRAVLWGQLWDLAN
jgi:hypothetical protein